MDNAICSLRVLNMVTKSGSRTASKLITEDDSIFGPPPVLKGEDPQAYAALFANVSRTVRPTDFCGKNLGARRCRSHVGDFSLVQADERHA